jgi:hypothetical protein
MILILAQIVVGGLNQTPTTSAPAGARPLVVCGRTCPANATIFFDGFESGTPVEGVIPGTTYGSNWDGTPHSGLRHMWLNIQNGLNNIDVYERRFDGYYMGCDVTFDYWYWNNTIGFDAEYVLLDDNNNVIDSINVITTAAEQNIYQNRVVTFSPTTTGITLRIHVNSTGGAGYDIAIDDFTITQCCAVILPVELLSFDAKCDNNKVNLKWTTTSEINNDYFTIERSPDALSFEPIGFINGKGNSSSLNVYNWVDANPLKGAAYYRLKQTDFNGAIEYHKTITTSCVNQSSISIYPNPFNDYLYIKTSSNFEDGAIVEIKDYLGRKVLQENVIWNEGVHQLNLDRISDKGIFFITINNQFGELVFHERIIKM